MEELIKAVRQHAEAHYDAGWDIVVEAMTDEEIEDWILEARTPKEAIAIMADYVKVNVEHAAEIRSTVW